MKQRIKVNNNACERVATVYEDNGQIIIHKMPPHFFDLSQHEKIVLHTREELEAFLHEPWITLVELISPFKNQMFNPDKSVFRKSHGGYRPGAGRKKELPEGAKTKSIIVTDEEFEQVKQFIRELRGV